MTRAQGVGSSRHPRRTGAARAIAARLAVASAATLIAAMALAAGGASGATTQESLFQDDDLLLYNTQAGTERTLDTLAALGVQRIRVSLVWAVVAPNALSRARPNFDAADPAAYPADAWNRYDAIVAEAAARGIAVDFDLMAPAPLWATGTPKRADLGNIYRPSAAEFALFVRAVGRRYSGTYTLPGPSTTSAAPSPPPSSGSGDLISALFGPPHGQNPVPPPPPPPAGTTLPRVDYWSIWNEPNQGGWLEPQWTPPGHARGLVETSPRIYRDLVDAAWSGLAGTGHTGDTILVGETAPKGVHLQGETRAMSPLNFIRVLYCVDTRLQPLRGRAAADRGCPTSARGIASFASDHPGLFRARGWAHHPYELTFAPNRAPRDPDFVTIANLSRLSSELDGIWRSYHQSGGLPLFMTEFGYMTDPPNPTGVRPALQAAYINQAEFMAYANPRVRSWPQFLLLDDRPLPGRNGVRTGYGATFQTGLMYLNGRRKPAFDAYRMPVYLPQPRVRRGAATRVWGIVRDAPAAGARDVAIQLARAGSGRFKTLATTSTQPRPAYFYVRVRVPSAGQLRVAWRNPQTGQMQYSRNVAISVR